MYELFEKLGKVLLEGSLPVMVPLILTCAGIGIIALERCLYLYDPRMVAWFWLPPIRRRLAAVRARVHDAFDEFLLEPTTARAQQLIAACQRYRTPYSRFLLRALAGGLPSEPRLRDLSVDRALQQEELAIERSFTLLGTFARMAPLLGLLGTVTGMIQTFAAMMVSATSDPRALSAGISVALIATNVGLLVGLPGIVAMSTLSRRGQTLHGELRLASMRLRGQRSPRSGEEALA